MRKINYKSDFDFILDIVNADGARIGWPAYDWELTLWAGSVYSTLTASRRGDRLVNCFEDGGRIHVVVNSPRLGTGRLKAEFHAVLPDGIYPDGTRDTFEPQELDIELVTGRSDEGGDMEVTLTLPFIYRTAYDMAVAAGYDGTEAEYNRALRDVGRVAVAVDDVLPRFGGEVARLAAEVDKLNAETGRLADGNDRLATEADRIAELVTAVEFAAGRPEPGYTLGNAFHEIGYTTADSVAPLLESLAYSKLLADEWNAGKRSNFSGLNKLVVAPSVDTSKMTVMGDVSPYASTMFGGCTALIYVPPLDTSNVTNMSRMFSGCSALASVSLDTSNVTIMEYMFSGCSALTSVSFNDVSNVTDMFQFLYGCYALESIKIKNLGCKCQRIEFSQCSKWGTAGEESRRSLTDTLVTHSHDRATAGLSAATVILAAATKALLTDEEKAQIAAKGFTIA